MDKVVLFVCTGNTCRSPLAEGAFNLFASRSGLTGVVGKSAGLCAVDGSRASGQSCAVAKENGFSLDEFRSQTLTQELVDEAFLIVGMTDNHCRVIRSAVPQAADKVRRLLEFDQDGEVADPYGGSVEA